MFKRADLKAKINLGCGASWVLMIQSLLTPTFQTLVSPSIESHAASEAVWPHGFQGIWPHFHKP